MANLLTTGFQPVGFDVKVPYLFQGFNFQPLPFFGRFFWSKHFFQAMGTATGGGTWGSERDVFDPVFLEVGNCRKDDMFIFTTKKCFFFWFFWGKLAESSLDIALILGQFLVVPYGAFKDLTWDFSWRSFSMMAISQWTWPGRWEKEGGWRGVRKNLRQFGVASTKIQPHQPPPGDLQMKLRLGQGGVL